MSLLGVMSDVDLGAAGAEPGGASDQTQDVVVDDERFGIEDFLSLASELPSNVINSIQLPDNAQLSVDYPEPADGWVLDDIQTFALPVPFEDVDEEVELYVTPPVASSTGLKGQLLKLIGPYDTIITQFSYHNNNNSYLTYVHDISPDFPWLVSSGLFIVLMLSVFRCFGRCLQLCFGGRR